MRRRARIDANHGDIVNAFRRFGASVHSLAAVGSGVPDLLCGWRGKTYLVEVKDGSKPKSAQQLTPDQVAFAHGWRGDTVHIARCCEDVERILWAGVAQEQG